MESSSILSPTQRYAAAALFALALSESQVHQTRTRKDPIPRNAETISDGGGKVAASDNPELWIHETFGLLWPVFRLLEVEDHAWHGLKETAGSSSQVRHHIGDFLTLLSEEGDGASSERLNKELALTKAVDATADSMESFPESKEVEYKGQADNIRATSPAVAAKPHETKDSSALQESIQKAPSLGPENRTSEQPVEEANLISYRRKVTVLYTLLSACVADTAEVDKKCSQSRQGYDARHRVALRLLATWLGINWIEMVRVLGTHSSQAPYYILHWVICEPLEKLSFLKDVVHILACVEAMEIMVAFTIMDSVRKGGANEEKSINSESNLDKWKREGVIGAAALTGGTLMAITGGLAAPAIAQGLGALAPTMGTLIPAVGGGFAAAATATGSAAGSVAVAASFGAAGAGLTGRKMATRTGALEEFMLKEVGGNQQGHLAVGIFISGLAFEEEDFLKPWEGHDDNLERYVLQWESKNLIALSTAIKEWLKSRVVVELMKEGAMTTVLSTLVAALAWPATLVTSFDLIDSKWAIALDRSNKAGKVLAEVLLEGLQGNRPATLVGFSLGARVIFKCLQYLAESKRDNAGLVERVVILGAPISIKDENWEAVRKMVAGRFVNAYSTNDWTLGIVFRASLLSQGLAGIQPVDVPGIENVDVTQLIEGHYCYLQKTRSILEQLELDNYYAVFRSGCKIPQEEKSKTTLEKKSV